MADGYIGAENGALKGIDFSKNTFQNYNSVSTLDRSEEISRMCRVDGSIVRVMDNDTAANDSRSADEAVLCALVNRQMKLFDQSTGTYTTLFNCDGGRGPIKGVEQLGSGKIATCVESGELCVWNVDGFSKETTVNAGDGICRMRLNPSKLGVVATGGRENPLKVWDLHQPGQPVFAAKNVRNDWLDLRVPIWVTDMRFSPTNETIFTCTGHQQIRMYDPRSGQRRPIAQIQWGDAPFNCISLTSRENQVVAGNSKGYMGLFDFRGKGTSKLVHLYKGFAGSISSIECHPSSPFVASCGIDRFARLHHLLTKEQMSKIYCKVRLNCMLLNDNLSIGRLEKEKSDDDDAYHSEESESVTSDDAVWDHMKKVNDKKRKYNHSEDSSGSERKSAAASGLRGHSKAKRKRKQCSHLRDNEHCDR